MKMKYYILIGVIVLTIASINSTYAFSPAPMAGVPELYILQDSSEIIVEEYISDIKISESTAKVSAQIKLKYIGEIQRKFNFSLYIRKEQVDILLNDELFNYSYQNRDFTYTFNPKEEFIIKTSYDLPISHTFSGPPGPWERGYAFKIDNYPIREERWKSKTISVCEINISFPSDFRVDPEPTEYSRDWIEDPIIEKIGNRMSYSLKTRSECPHLTFSKVTSKDDIFIDTISKPPLMIYIAIIIGLITIGFIVFYKFKKRE